MIIFKRKRLLVWLIRAYVKKWGVIILASFAVGLALFGLMFLNRGFLLSKIPFTQSKSIGLVGSFYPKDLPPVVIDKMSNGLTYVGLDGNPKPDLARSWTVSKNGRKYTFYLRSDRKFVNGDKFISRDVNYNFQNVKVTKPDDYTVVFELTDSYSPFLSTVSQKLFKKNFIGTGEYKVRSLKLNAGYVQSVELENQNNVDDRVTYQFYPTEEALKMAFTLGEVDEIQGINTTDVGNYDLKSFKNNYIKKDTDYRRLVTIFYNTNDKDLSNKTLRKALSYSIPSKFSEGERSFTPIRSMSWAASGVSNIYLQDFDHSKLLLKEVESSGSAKLKITLKTLHTYRKVANEIAVIWKGLGIETNIEEVAGIPDPTSYSAFLGDLYLPRDPDQYSIWHSGQFGNVTNYRSLRIDKLLEDGRRTTDLSERKNIYADFEKYLLDDSPATFLFYPSSYTISRKPF